MNNYLKPSNIVFYILSIIVCFFFGMSFAGVINAGRNQGLAGGAIVFGYGIMFAFAALIGSFVAVKFIKEKSIILLNKILAVVLVLFIVFLVYRILTINSAATSFNQIPQPLNNYIFAGNDFRSGPEKSNVQMGLGMSKPKFYENNVIYFYGDPNFEKSVSDHSPMDSLVFKRTEIGIELTYAPPWFVPAHLKMDYEILFLRVVTLHREFIGAVVNESNEQIAFMDRYKNDIQFWPEFLLTINSVEPLNLKSNPIRARPFPHASLSPVQYSILKPVRISDQWIEVELLDDNLNSKGKGWFKWQENGKLLITYSLLS